MRKRRKKKKGTVIDADTVIDLDAQREARRRQLREAAAESRRRRGVPDPERSGYDYYGYRPETSQDEKEETETDPEEVPEGDLKKEKRSGRKRKPMTPARIVVIVVVVIALICLSCSIWKIVSLKLEESRSRDRIAELKEEKKELQEEVSGIGTEAYIEEQARQWLKMAKSGEIIYVFGSEEDQKNDQK